MALSTYVLERSGSHSFYIISYIAHFAGFLGFFKDLFRDRD